MKRTVISISIAVLIFSCSESETNIPLQEDSNFYALTVGNSWVYKNYRLNDQTNTYLDTGVIDSINIVSREDVNGTTYYKVRRKTTGNEQNITLCNPNGENYELLRDSIGYLINDTGKIKFTNTNFEERVISDNLNFNIREVLMTGSTQIDVEAGSFTCIYSERYAVNSSGQQLSGLDLFYYSDGFGLIYDTSSFANSDEPTIIRRLDSYIVQ